MSFNEKLQSLRKEKKLSQEQLADMLDVTRQSVSKWESGTTYPEMDKLIMLTKIFNCSLDDLTNDEVSEISIEKKTNSPLSLNVLLEKFLGFIENTVKMFKSMKGKDIWICLFVMFDIALILLVFNIPLEIFKDHFSSMMLEFGSLKFANIASGIFDFILTVVFYALYIIVLVYIFKVAYLDRYDFVQTEKHEEIVEEKEPIKEVRIVTNPSSSKVNPLFKVLGGIALGFVKFLAACFAIPILFALVVVCFFLAIDVYLITQGITFIGILLLLLFAILGCSLLIETVSTFLFNKKFPYKRLLWTFIITLAGLGISFGISVLELGRFDYVDSLPKNSDIEEVAKETTIPMQDDLKLTPYCQYCYVKYEEDDSLGSNIQVSISYYKGFLIADIDLEDSTIIVDRSDFGEFAIMKNVWSQIKKDLKNNTIYDYDLFNEIEVTIKGSKKNLEKIQANTKKELDELSKEERQDEYYDMVDQYEAEIDDYERQIEDLQEENQNLQDKVQELEEYKERVQGILGT